MKRKPRLLKTRTEITCMRADELRAFRDELERMRRAGDNRQRVLDTYEYVIETFQKRRISLTPKPATLLPAAAIYKLKAEELRTMIRKLEGKNPIPEVEYNTLALLRLEEERRATRNAIVYRQRKAAIQRAMEVVCSTP